MRGAVCRRVYHGGQGCVQAGLRLAVIRIAVLVAAAVIDKTDLQVHAALQPAGERKERDEQRTTREIQTVFDEFSLVLCPNNKNSIQSAENMREREREKKPRSCSFYWTNSADWLQLNRTCVFNHPSCCLQCRSIQEAPSRSDTIRSDPEARRCWRGGTGGVCVAEGQDIIRAQIRPAADQ